MCPGYTQTDGRTDATKYIISLASRSIMKGLSHILKYFCGWMWHKGTTINELGVGPEDIKRINISKALLQEKIIFKRLSSRKNKLILDFSSAPQIINGRPL